MILLLEKEEVYYQQVKDNRSEQAYSNVFEILDGALDDVVEDVLVSLRK